MKTKILLVGIDGLILKTALDSGRAPMLKSLKESGYFNELTMDAPTLSGPGWSTLLTGSTHAQHAVTDNRFSGHNLLYRPDLLSRAFYQDQSTTTFAAAGWPPLVDPSGVGPVIHERREQARASQHRVISRDGETYGYEKVDAEIANISIFAMEKFGPVVSCVFFCDAAEAGHRDRRHPRQDHHHQPGGGGAGSGAPRPHRHQRRHHQRLRHQHPARLGRLDGGGSRRKRRQLPALARGDRGGHQHGPRAPRPLGHAGGDARRV